MTKRKPNKPRSASSPQGRYAYDGLDRVFHEKARLGIVTSLMTDPHPLTFSDLKLLCSLSDGNLNRHLVVLQEAGFLDIEKEGAGRGSRTVCQLTRSGRAAFLQYLSELERVLADATTAQDHARRAAEPFRPGWSAS